MTALANHANLRPLCFTADADGNLGNKFPRHISATLNWDQSKLLAQQLTERDNLPVFSSRPQAPENTLEGRENYVWKTEVLSGITTQYNNTLLILKREIQLSAFDK